MKQIGVDCRFAIDGTIDVRRVYLDGSWQAVEQGRQWVDAHGRHVLIMLPDSDPKEILLAVETLTWRLLPIGGRQEMV